MSASRGVPKPIAMTARGRRAGKSTTPRRSLAILGALALLATFVPAAAHGVAAARELASGAAAREQLFECQVKDDDPGRNDACPVWESSYESPQTRYLGGAMDTGAGVFSPDGALYFVPFQFTPDEDVSGEQCADGHECPGVAAFHTDDGSLAWAQEYKALDGMSASDPFASIQGLVVSPDGSVVYAAGYTFASFGRENPHAVGLAVDAATGQLLWSRRLIDVPSYAGDVAVSADGTRLAITGWSFDFSRAMTTVVIDSATGEPLSMDTFLAAGRLGTEGARVVAAPEDPSPEDPSPDDPTFYALGFTIQQFGGFNMAFDQVIRAYDADGGLRWSSVQAHGEGGQDPPYAFAITPNGKQLVALRGFRVWDNVDGGHYKRVLVSVNDAMTGQETRQVVYANPDHEWTKAPDSFPGGRLAMDPGGERVYFTATVLNPGAGAAQQLVDPHSGGGLDIVAVDLSSGSILWSTTLQDRRGTPAYIPEGAVAADPTKDQIYVNVFSDDSPLPAPTITAPGEAVLQRWILTATYDATSGSQLALSRYGYWSQQSGVPELRGTPFRIDIAVTPDGSKVLSPSPHLESGTGVKVVAYDTTTTGPATGE